MKRPQCTNPDCKDDAVLGGYCQKHNDENDTKWKLRNQALNILHSGSYPKELNQELKDTYYDILSWWDKACTVARFQNRYSEDWLCEKELINDMCIFLMQEIIKFQDTHLFDIKKEHFYYNIKSLRLNWETI